MIAEQFGRNRWGFFPGDEKERNEKERNEKEREREKEKETRKREKLSWFHVSSSNQGEKESKTKGVEFYSQVRIFSELFRYEEWEKEKKEKEREKLKLHTDILELTAFWGFWVLWTFQVGFLSIDSGIESTHQDGWILETMHLPRQRFHSDEDLCVQKRDEGS